MEENEWTADGFVINTFSMITSAITEPERVVTHFKTTRKSKNCLDCLIAVGTAVSSRPRTDPYVNTLIHTAPPLDLA